MAGLDPAIHVFDPAGLKDVDARDKRGHDDGASVVRYFFSIDMPLGPRSMRKPSGCLRS